jgi:hypothetical protein
VQRVTEPALKLLSELSSAGMPSLREYNVLLEPPDVQRK